MDRGIYSATSSGLINLRKLEVTTNNLANLNTPGFKKEMILTDSQNFDQTLAKEVEKSDPYAKGDHDRTPGVTNIRTVTDFTPGPIKTTGNALDVALVNPNQFFGIQTSNGIEYTRAGNFTLDAAGTIVTPDGLPVIGSGGPIIANGPGIRITADGSVMSDNSKLGSIQIFEVAKPEFMERSAGTRFKTNALTGTANQTAGSLVERSVEMPNLSAVSSIVEMITANRGFEMYTRTVQSIDQINQSAITQVGKGK